MCRCSFFSAVSPPHRAIGTSAALVVFYAGFAAANYAFTGWSETRGVPGTLGFIYLPAWIFMVPASMIAAHFGARAAGRIDPKPLRSIIAVLLALIGVRFVAALFI
ncbi:MAG: sulfite exporter TauE/SafE family protein [Deltaproteobacteria bacterium]|nr:sulfite exporter TauE/SafE family protein [Deltaproteobacteria bacterium]